MADVWWVLRHREHGAVDTYVSYEEALKVLRGVLEDEPDWVLDVWIEPFELHLTNPRSGTSIAAP